MQRLNLQQRAHQRLSEQQIQYLRLLGLSHQELNAHMDDVLMDNPVLEETSEEEGHLLEEEEASYASQAAASDESASWQSAYYAAQQTDASASMADNDTLETKLKRQLSLLKLNPKEHLIGAHIIGSLDENGYLRQALNALCDELLLLENTRCTPQEIEEVLKKIQNFDPPGIGARDLQECLILQVQNLSQSPERAHALRVLKDHYPSFTSKQYAKLQKQLRLSRDALKAALALITSRNPKPGESQRIQNRPQTIYADFVLERDQTRGTFKVTLRRSPKRIGLNAAYIKKIEAQLQTSSASQQESKQFLKAKKEHAHMFLNALETRKKTLLEVGKFIVEKQKAFIQHRDKAHLQPMKLKDLAERLHLDPSTLSRIVTNKYLAWPDGSTMALRALFTQAIDTKKGQVSQSQLKEQLVALVAQEDKEKPLTDTEIHRKLVKMGYQIARRTVAKYRINLQIPDSRLRKNI